MSIHKTPELTRRRLLVSGLLAGAGFAMRDFLPAFAVEPTAAAKPNNRLLVFYFSGGWDGLLALDPRDNNKFGPDDGIWPAYDLVAKNDGEVNKVMATSKGSGLIQPPGSNIAFGPAIGRLAEQAAELCIVRGMNMGTLSHEVGYRYFLTGKFPTGLRARGSSLSTWFAAQTGDETPVPNLVVGMETYNENLPLYSSGLQVNTASQIMTVVSRLGAQLPPESDAAIQAFLQSPDCANIAHDGENATTAYFAARKKAVTLVSGNIPKAFEFSTTPSPALLKLYTALHIEPAKVQNELNAPKGRAAIAVQAMTQGASQAIAVRLVDGLDTHYGDWQTSHAKRLRDGFDAVADVISYLKDTPDADGKPWWDRTTILCCSEFTRTPKINVRGGRDHHLAAACLVAGKGIKGNTVIGATSDAVYGSQAVHLQTGNVDPNGVMIRPTDVHATLLKAAGLSYAHLTNVSPKIVQAMLKA
ncbi:MAG: DUF1501 domain-containing protein [Myxococcales bacterium]|nr:DUF1501 domain-containing protein [Myxococcales bacterium]